MRPSRMLTLMTTPGIRVKRWLLFMFIGISFVAIGTVMLLLNLTTGYVLINSAQSASPIVLTLIILAGLILIIYAVYQLARNLLMPYRMRQRGSVVDTVVDFSRRHRGFKYVAIGGGTGLPASLHDMKQYTGNITAIVTVADDGGSSGRLRRDLGVLPPGDLRNNIAALADDDSMLTQLFQYRFETGDLKGHSFGNLFIAALANVVNRSGDENSFATALTEISRILNIRGRVLPATLEDINITAEVRLKGSDRTIKILGESQIETVNGSIEHIEITPEQVEAYPESVQAILDADIIVIGPGSLYTSILPNLVVEGIRQALENTEAFKIYVCNVATQPVETENYTVADHVVALEKHIGQRKFNAVIANNAYPQENAGRNTHYVRPAPENHEIFGRYQVYYTDLTDVERPVAP